MRISQCSRPLVVDRLLRPGNSSAECLKVPSERLTELVDGFLVGDRKPDSPRAVLNEFVLHTIDQGQLQVCQPLRELLVGIKHETKPFENRGRILGDELLCPVVQIKVRDVSDHGLALGKGRGQLRVLAQRICVLNRVDGAASPLQHQRLYQTLIDAVVCIRLSGIEVPEIEFPQLLGHHQTFDEAVEILILPGLPHGSREVDIHVVPGQVRVLVLGGPAPYLLDLALHFGKPFERLFQKATKIRGCRSGVLLSEIPDNLQKRSKLLWIRHRLYLRDVFIPRRGGSNLLSRYAQQFATPKISENIADRKIPDERRLMFGDPIDLQEFSLAIPEVLELGLRFPRRLCDLLLERRSVFDARKSPVCENEVSVEQQSGSLKPIHTVWDLPDRTVGPKEMLEEGCLDSVLVDQ